MCESTNQRSVVVVLRSVDYEFELISVCPAASFALRPFVSTFSMLDRRALKERLFQLQSQDHVACRRSAQIRQVLLVQTFSFRETRSASLLSLVERFPLRCTSTIPHCRSCRE